MNPNGLHRFLARSIFPVLLVIIALALGLRLIGLQWDQGNFFHPDERSIYMRVDCMHRVLTVAPYYQDCIRAFPDTEPGVPSWGVFLDSERSPLNPHWFPLGGIIIYLLLMVKVVFSPIVTMGIQDLAIAGRTISALMDVGSVVMIYLLGRRVFDNRVGLLAAGLLAVTVAHIQNSHFYRPETFIVFFTLGSFWCMLRVMSDGRWRDWGLLGLFLGLAIATKVSVLPIFLPLALVVGMAVHRATRSDEKVVLWGRLVALLARGILGATVAVVVYVFWNPYAVLALDEFLSWTLREIEIVRNPGIVPYTLQYVGTSAVTYELRQTIVWALGVPLGVLAYLGFVVSLVRNVRHPRSQELLLLVWAIPFFLLVVFFEVKFLRYIFPLLSVLVLLGAALLVALWDFTRRNYPRFAPLAVGISVFVVLASVFYAFAFERIYVRDHPAVQASGWINTNVLPGVHILTDNHWDEGFPGLHKYKVEQLPMYESDSEQKVKHLVSRLAEADYILSYSNRVYGSIPRVPEEYPVSSNYYNRLFSGDLGYRLEKSFTTYPRFLGVAFANDTFRRPGLPVPEGMDKSHLAPLTFHLGYADENVVNYDHPLVLLFRNVDHKPVWEIDWILSQSFESQVSRDNGPLMLSQPDAVAQEAAGDWSSLFGVGWANRFPVLTWLLVVIGVTILAFPISLAIFRRLPDRGILFATPLGILLVGYPTWLSSHLGWVDFSRESAFLSFILVAIASGIILAFQGRDMLSFIRSRWRYVVSVEALFLIAFFSFLLIRMANPDLWHPWRGGEKPMDLAYLTAVVKSINMPPYDPWFAGGYLNYYYLGHFLLGNLIKVTGIAPAIAYNLAIPLLFAVTVTGAFTLGYNLAEIVRRHRFPGALLRGPILAGILSFLFVVVLGNLDGAVQLIQGSWDVIQGEKFPRFEFWRSSRMVPGQLVITEFPFWTFLFADLHAHLMVIPFTLVALGLVLALIMDDPVKSNWVGIAGRTLILALVVGAFAAINTWELPTYLGLGVSAFVIMAIMGKGDVRERIVLTSVLACVFVLLAILFFLPYHLVGDSKFEGVRLSTWHTSFHYYLAIHGLFFVVAIFYLGRDVFESLRTSRRVEANSVWWTKLIRSYPSFTALLIVGVFIGLFVLVSYATVGIGESLASYHTTVILLGLLTIVVLLAFRRFSVGGTDTRIHLFVLLLLGSAFAIGIGADLFVVEGDIDRMNTVFKFYLQAWVFYALAGAFAVWYLWVSGWGMPWGRLFSAKATWVSVIVILFLASAIFPVLGTRARLADRFNVLPLTLNGFAFMEERQTVFYDEERRLDMWWDTEAMEWLRENVHGSPVVLEAVTPQYRWGGRVSIYTGLPTVLGWPWHQIQQRDWGSVQRRERDIKTIYSTQNIEEALLLLREYDVSYIYIGPVERLYYPERGLHKFVEMTANHLTVEFRNAEVTIYRAKWH
jgi:YYY domain-containing protein